MKNFRSIYTVSFIAFIAFIGCKKDQISTESNTRPDKSEVSTPVADFAIYGIDSSKVPALSVTQLDSLANAIVRTFSADYLLPLQEGVSTRVYKQKVIIRYTGSFSNYKAIYTGMAGSIYVANPSNPPTGVTATQAGVSMGETFFATYNAGTYPITVIATNVGDKGRNIQRSVMSKNIILQ